MIGHGDIKTILPHRYPMALVDKVVSLSEGNQIVALKNVTGCEFCYAELEDNTKDIDYAYPQSLIIESFCQAAGILYNYYKKQNGSEVKGLMLFGSIGGFDFFEDVYPGDQMEHHARLDKGFEDSAVFSGEIQVNGKKVAEVDQIVVAIRSEEILSV